MSTASLHDPVRHPDESQAQYRIRLAQSRRIARTFATGFRRSAEPGFQDQAHGQSPSRQARSHGSAAPELLAALQEAEPLLTAFIAYLDANLPSGAVMPTLGQVRAAIAKATGATK